MATDDLSTAGARRLVKALADREVGALELCNAAIERIEAGDRDINAVVVRDFDRARAQARAADAAIARGERRALLGVPLTVKESFDVAGLRTTWGFEFARHLPPATVDAVAVARLKAAGAVLLGKTNCALALADWQTVNPVYGRTAHPLDLSRTPGGSSGGSAAALAAGFVPLELGSDLVGSIRVPAHFCGLAGHKPSHGLCPRRGHNFPGAPYGSHDDPIGVIGPMAREVGDLALALEVLAGPEDDAAVAYRLSLPPPRHDGRLAGLRVLVVDRHPGAAVSEAVRAAVHQAADRLASAGADVRHVSPLLPDLGALLKSYGAMVTAFVTRGQPGPVISAHDWMGLLDEQARVRLRCRQLFETVDVVLCPPFGTPAYAHQEDRQVLRIDGQDTPYDAQGAWASLASFAGLPATVVPIATTDEGLPIGVQIVGPFLHDRTTLAVAEGLQSG